MNRQIPSIILGTVVFVVLFVVVLVLNLPEASTPTFATVTRTIMAAPISVTADESVIHEASSVVFEAFEDVDTNMSEWKPGSPLTAVNEAAGERPVKVPESLLNVIERGIRIGEQTDGAFDITWAALWGLWDFNAESPSLPKDAEIQARLPFVNYRKVAIDREKGTVYLPEVHMLIGLGGIAKGTALNRAAGALRERGINDFLISAGGQILASGTKVDRSWRIGIRDPRGDATDYFARLELVNESSATSGDYERFFILDEVRYHHILDPRTGYPARGLRSATVISADAELADALSTAVMVMSADRGFALLQRLEGVEGVLVDDRGAMRITPGLESRIEIIHEPTR